jgi:3-methyladenine DNA glycosylase/8-oxoguanine DNA glycosylase
MFEMQTPIPFDIRQTFECGQAFRWKNLSADSEVSNSQTYQGVAGNQFLSICQSDNTLSFSCSEEEFHSFWHNYLDFNTDYGKIQAELSAFDPLMREAISYAPGIRILKQNPWETLCSFIISQNNNIPRISGIIDRFCTLLGQEIAPEIYTFPTAESVAALSAEDLSPIRAGFRSKYLIAAAQAVVSGIVDLDEISTSPIAFGREALQKIHGVGPKVAECVLLYGFYKTEAFPMDVWMKRAMETLFPAYTPKDFGGNAGMAQQYIFHYSRTAGVLRTDGDGRK